jgi:hypothetical protein
VGPGGSETERRRAGARGLAREKEKWVGPKERVKFFIYSNNFQVSLNCFDQKVDLPSSKIFKSNMNLKGIK